MLNRVDVLQKDFQAIENACEMLKRAITHYATPDDVIGVAKDVLQFDEADILQRKAVVLSSISIFNDDLMQKDDGNTYKNHVLSESQVLAIFNRLNGFKNAVERFLNGFFALPDLQADRFYVQSGLKDLMGQFAKIKALLMFDLGLEQVQEWAKMPKTTPDCVPEFPLNEITGVRESIEHLVSKGIDVENEDLFAAFRTCLCHLGNIPFLYDAVRDSARDWQTLAQGIETLVQMNKAYNKFLNEELDTLEHYITAGEN